MITVNLVDPREGGAYRSGGALVLSGPVRTKNWFSWLRIEVRTALAPEILRRGIVRKAYPWTYTSTPRAPWEAR